MLGDVAKVQDAARQVSKSDNSLHLNRVAFFQGMIQNSRSITVEKQEEQNEGGERRSGTKDATSKATLIENLHHLPAQVFVVTVSNKQGLGGKSIWLHVHVTTSDLVHEARFPNVGQTAHKNGTCVGIQRWKTG